jgi:hypothetical protein
LSESSNRYTNFSPETSNEPRALQLIRWAIRNPEKIAAMGFGLAAFGLAAFFLGNYKQDRLERAGNSERSNLDRTQ